MLTEIVETARSLSLLKRTCASVESVPVDNILTNTGTGFVHLQLTKKWVKEVCESAKSGCLDSCAKVAQFYATGFGMPRSLIRAQDWGSFAIMQAATITFEEAEEQLDDDLAEVFAECPGDYIVPKPVQVVRKRITTLLNIEQGEAKSGHVIPLIRGKRVAVMYRQIDKLPVVCGVYHMTPNGPELDHDTWAALNVPRYFGEVRQAPIRLDFYPYGKKSQYFIVTGTITTPLSRMKARKKRFENETVKSLYAKIAKRNSKTDDVQAPLGDLPDRSFLNDKSHPSYYLRFIAEELFTLDGKGLAKLDINAAQQFRLIQSLGFEVFANTDYFEKSCVTVRNGKFDDANISSVVNAVSRHYAVAGYFVRNAKTFKATR